MRCPKCSQENSGTNQFCLRCHAPLRYTCPGCHHQQDHGGQCDQCGLDFAKYAAMMVFQAQTQAQKQREKSRTKNSIIKQVLLLPITGGLSLLGYLRSRARRE